MATLGALDILISVKDNNVESQLKNTESKVKKAGDRLSAWTVAKGQMIGRFAEKAIATTARVAKETIKGAIDAYADYEQLVGGVDTLFKDSSKKVQDYASKAYMTAGVSANEYMETVTSFSASLLQSLAGDTEKAADISDMAMIDMSDNVNKMGSSMESVQNAYKGFAKQNYTMLDNLKLGYGGTKKEMDRLLKDATKLTGQKYDIKNLSDVYEAIHAIQEEMGIAGTTQQEAMTTVTGSMNAAKAAWKDVLVSIGRGKDIRKSIKQFADTAKTYIKNLKPVLKESVSGVFTAIKELLPEFGDLFDGLKKDLKESDVPLLRVLGGVLETVDNISTGITNLATDFDATVAAMKESDDPFVKLAGGALETAKNIIKWIGENADWVANNIGKIAAAFGAIVISKDVLKFMSLLQSSGVASAISKLFGGGAGAAGAAGAGAAGASGAGTAGAGAGKFGLWGLVKTGITNTAKTLPYALPIALLADTVADSINMWKDGQEKAKESFEKAMQFKNDVVDKSGNEGLNEAWDTLASYFSTMYGDETTITEKNNRLIDFAKRYDDYMNKDKDDKMIDALTDLIVDNDELWSDLYDTMSLINKKGDRGYTEEEQNMVENTMQRVKEAVEEGLASEAVKAPVDPEVDLKSAQSQLDGAGLSVPVQPKLTGFLGKWFGQAKGDWSVPYDNYPSLLHRGEIVLNQSQSRRYRDGETGKESTVNLPSVIARSVKESMKQVNFLLNGNRVADLTTRRTNKNIKTNSYSTLKAYGG